MTGFKVLPISNEIARQIRASMIDQNGNPVVASIAPEAGYGPCRSCLKQFEAGDRRLLFSYSPNPVDHAFNETGPIFIHADYCEPYESAEVFPPEIENGRIKFPLAFRAYDENGVMLDAVLPNGESPDETIRSIFENERVAFAHVRNQRFGCFVAHVDRAG